MCIRDEWIVQAGPQGHDVLKEFIDKAELDEVSGPERIEELWSRQPPGPGGRFFMAATDHSRTTA
jgi:hypothetical protein